MQYIVVPEPQGLPTLAPEKGVSLFIAIVGVSAAVYLDDELCFNAGEIYNVGRDRMLSAKAMSEPTVTKFSPKRTLRIGRVSAKVLTAPRQ